MKEKLTLSDGEWKLMHLLWAQAPRTVAQLVKALENDTGWSKATIFIMLGRLEDKGAVTVKEGGRSKEYYPAVEKSVAAAGETRHFLDKVYSGSVGMMLSSLAGQKALSQAEIDELYAILRRAEEEAETK